MPYGEDLELALQEADTELFRQYISAKDEILHAYDQVSISGLNDHSAQHILRVIGHLQGLLGRDCIAQRIVTAREVYLALMAVLFHDLGLLEKRSEHGRVIHDALLKANRVPDLPRLAGGPETYRIIAKAVLCHSGDVSIDDEFAGFPQRLPIEASSVRPRLIAALLRLADELDEDRRRAPALAYWLKDIPRESDFYWRFSQRIASVKPNPTSSIIEIFVQLEAEDIRSQVVFEGEDRLFVAAFAEKLTKMNRERQRVNPYLPEGRRFDSIVVTVMPPLGDNDWRSPRQFGFSDHTQASEFLAAFPEWLGLRQAHGLANILLLMRTGFYDDARIELSHYLHKDNVRLEDRLKALYNLACVESLVSATLSGEEKMRHLATGQRWLETWIDECNIEVWETNREEAERALTFMCRDVDLQELLIHCFSEVSEHIPIQFKSFLIEPVRTGYFKGCIVEGTMIDTPDGPTPVEELEGGNTIWTFDIERKELQEAAIGSITSRQEPVAIAFGASARCTPGHLIHGGRGWQTAIEQCEHTSSTRALAICSEPILGCWRAYSIDVNHPNHNFLVEGFLCHNEKA